jgi:Acetyl xylan esterase (AXE1)
MIAFDLSMSMMTGLSFPGRSTSLLAVVFVAALPALAGSTEDRVSPDMLRVLGPPAEPGPRITPLLRRQLDLAWTQDESRRQRFAAIRTADDLAAAQREFRAALSKVIGGLPTERTPLDARVTGTISQDGYRIEKLVFESLPGLHVTALVYVPEIPGPRPAILLASGHSPLGKAHPPYQEIAVRLARRGYVVLCWDPVGQGERSQYWDAERGRSRYNLVCGEHAILGNLATLAGASLLRWMIWDGIRAIDYLQTRPDVDGARIAITGTSGGGCQTVWIGALDERVGAILPSCFVTALPMRMANRIFEDPDSDPEQDPPGLVSEGIDHPGLLLLAYPRPVHVAAAVKDFFPIEGTRKTVREVAGLYRALGQGERFVLSEGYHGHQYSLENQRSAFAFLDRVFGRASSPVAEAVTPLDPEQLRCTRSGQVRVDYPGRSLAEVIRDLERGREPEPLDIRGLYHDQGYPGIQEWAVEPWHPGLPPERIGVEPMGHSSLRTTVIDRYVLHHSGLDMPLLHIHRAGVPAARVVLRAGLDGKVGTDDWPAVADDLRRGDHVVSFDPRGLGEMRMRYRAESVDDPTLAAADEAAAYQSPVSGVLANFVYNAQLTGRPYFLQMIEDAEVAARFARLKLGARRLAVTGEGESRTLAIAIAACLSDVELLPSRSRAAAFSWRETVEQMRETWPIHFLLPGGAYLRMDPGRPDRR